MQMLGFIIGLLVGLLLMWLIAGFIVYNIGKPLNQWFQDHKQITLGALISWPQDVSRMAHAGVTTGKDLQPHNNVVAGRTGNTVTGTTEPPRT